MVYWFIGVLVKESARNAGGGYPSTHKYDNNNKKINESNDDSNNSIS